MRTSNRILAGICILAAFTCCSHHNDNKQGDGDTTIADTAITNAMMPASTDELPECDTLSSDSSMDEPVPSAKELKELKDRICDRMSQLKGNPVLQNVYGIAVGIDAVEVYMAINTPFWQEEFRKNISASKHIVFNGPDKPDPIVALVNSVAELPAITLQPDHASFPADSEFATFTLSNDSDCNISFGERYIIGYQDASGIWYELPQPGIINDLGIELKPSGKYPIKAALHPKLNHNAPGIYRLYKQIRIDDDKDKVWIMTEFNLD